MSLAIKAGLIAFCQFADRQDPFHFALDTIKHSDFPMILFEDFFHSTLLSYCLGGLFSVLLFFCTSPSPSVCCIGRHNPPFNPTPIL